MPELPSPDASTKVDSPGGLPTLFERYQVLGVLGEGGMGTVYKGYHVNLKRFVAIKTLRIDRINSPEVVSRFLREMELVGQMDHPNVVRASDAGEKNGVFHLVMEYLTGSDLAQLVAARGRLGAADACELARQAAVGLEYIHQTLVHRDIKPSNLMLTTAGVVKILDLGLARVHLAGAGDGEHTPRGCVMGSYDYMAPEQAAATARVDGRADLYSLGCTLFKLLTGRAPFDSPEYDTATKKFFAHGHVPLTAVPAFGSIPEGLGEVLLRMTAKVPAERYPSAREVARALEPFAADARPLQLLPRAGGDRETPVRPLPQPLPEELGRLTDAPHETTRSRLPPPARERPKRSLPWRRVLGAAFLACALAVLVWFFAPTPFRQTGDGKTGPSGPGQPGRPGQGTAGLRSLDALKPQTYHRLLDQPPLSVGGEGEDPRKWRWDKDQQLLDVNGADLLLFQLGTTARSRFTLEVGIAQAPWTGNVGVFWGYREDATIKKARALNQEFAWFQMALIWHRVGDRGEDTYSVRRGQGALSYGRLGELQMNSHYRAKQDVPPLTAGEKILVLTVDQNRLRRALLGSIELTGITSAAANKAVEAAPYDGALGLITLSHHATFGNVRFIAHSSR
jgi:serine/threonine protein kinase